MKKTDFIKLLKKVKHATSITGEATYDNFSFLGDIIHFTRVNTQKNWKINLVDLYRVYSSLSYIRPSILRKIMTGKIYSPAWAILVQAGLFDRRGFKVA